MSYSKKLPVGSLGVCHTAIANGAWGEAFIHYVPPQAKGQWDLGTYQIHALENIRENRDIIIVSANNGAIEHTPQEIKYMNLNEEWQRVDEIFPLPVTDAYVYDDYAAIAFTATTTQYDIGTNARAADSSRPLFEGKSILLFATQNCRVRFNGSSRVQHFINSGAYYTFDLRVRSIHVVRDLVNGTLQVWVTG